MHQLFVGGFARRRGWFSRAGEEEWSLELGGGDIDDDIDGAEGRRVTVSRNDEFDEWALKRRRKRRLERQL